MSLFNHQLEPIYKLIEILLKYNMKTHLPSVILALIDYFGKCIYLFIHAEYITLIN